MHAFPFLLLCKKRPCMARKPGRMQGKWNRYPTVTVRCARPRRHPPAFSARTCWPATGRRGIMTRDRTEGRAMPDDTRITANPVPKETRITAALPSEADTRICLGYFPRKQEPKPSLLRWIWKMLLLPWIQLSVVFIPAFILWLIVQYIAAGIEFKHRQAQREYEQKQIDRFLQEIQRSK